MEEFGITAAVIIAVVQIAKGLGLDSKFAPVLAVLLGIIGNLGARFVGTEIWELVIGGLVVGLTAAGTYDVIKPPIVSAAQKIAGAIAGKK